MIHFNITGVVTLFFHSLVHIFSNLPDVGEMMNYVFTRSVMCSSPLSQTLYLRAFFFPR